MRESLMYGSVRGTRGNSRPYRDVQFAAVAHDRFAYGTKETIGLAAGGSAYRDAADEK
jgi:hypothetical protein